MAEQFETFKQFQDEAIALDIGQVLTTAGIACEIASMPKMLDAQFVGIDSTPNYSLKIYPNDFEEANKILNKYFEEKAGEADKDYFIFSFTNQELEDVVKKPDEWGEYNYQLARIVLKERGANVTDAVLKQLKEERKTELGKAETPDLFLYVGSFFLIACAVLFLFNKSSSLQSLFFSFFSVFGYFMGRHLRNHKKVLPDGQIVKVYKQSDRKAGGIIEIVCLVLVLLSAAKLLLFTLGYFPENAYE